MPRRFRERRDVPALLREAHKRGCAIDLADVSYYVGHETVVRADDEKALPRWVEALFAFNAVVEIGREISVKWAELRCMPAPPTARRGHPQLPRAHGGKADEPHL